MSARTPCAEQSTLLESPAHQFAITRQSPLIADLIALTYPANTSAKDSLRAQELAYELGALSNTILDVTQQGCVELWRVSAGLAAVLRLLEADEEADEEADMDTVGIHCLLAPLKAQLDEAVSRVQAMI
ncbi:hypothetical protein BKK79_27450 [Cupriavidus sp. USMAA2-4]|uniref:DUF1484 family protein n=1 Tax=Cupriavidus sp. USMAA2-4 TaxID=876364 RepID=UPI0008A6CBD1|nr:DUF1484 family protein [Cupriavidus sp. USMAA2-4]AOY95492.1 hypothetical protein BKK79_27450 [Cupriavidus sp. USMAA2-4]